MPMSPERRAEIRAAVDRATVGPWRRIGAVVHLTMDPAHHVWIERHPVESDGSVHDQNFIAGSRDWVPELLDELDRLTPLHAGTVDEVRSLLDNIESMQQEIFGLRDQLKEWEKYTGFLHAHGFFRDANTPSADATLTTTEDPPHV